MPKVPGRSRPPPKGAKNARLRACEACVDDHERRLKQIEPACLALHGRLRVTTTYVRALEAALLESGTITREVIEGQLEKHGLEKLAEDTEDARSVTALGG